MDGGICKSLDYQTLHASLTLESTSYFIGLLIGPVIAGNIAQM
jgi:hypothetical protein